MPRMVCVQCKVKLRPERNGVHVVETFGEDSDEPYKLWRADLYKCPKCGVEVVAGFGAPFNNNYAEHYQSDFAMYLEAAEPKYWDKSCGG